MSLDLLENDTDDKFNPLAEREKNSSIGPEREQIAGYDRDNDGLDAYDSSSADAIRDKEDKQPESSKSPWANNFTNKNTKTTGRFKGLKKGGPLGFASLLLGGGAIVTLLGPALAPIAFLDNVLDDLDDHTAALTVRSTLLNNLRNSPANKSVKYTATFAKKYRSISDTQKNRLQRAGIEVVGDNKSIVGRTIPEKYKFRGVEYDAAAWAKEVRTNSAARNAQLRANNMRSLSTRAGPFSKLVVEAFGLNRTPNKLQGSDNDKLNQILTAANTDDIDSVKVVEGTGEEGKGEKDKFYIADADGNPSLATAFDSQESANKAIDNVKASSKSIKTGSSAKSASAVKTGLGKSASILGYADMACTIKNMVGAATVAAKVVSKTSLLKYAWSLSTMIESMKAGDITPEDAETLGKFLTETDNRKQITDISKLVSARGDNSAEISDDIDSAQADNPNYGKSAMDSSLLSMSINGGVAPVTETTSSFALGTSPSRIFGVTQGVLQAINSVSDSTCNVVQNWFVRGLSYIAGAVAFGLSGGTSMIMNVSIMGGLVVAMISLNTVVNSALKGNILDVLADGDEKVGRGDAAWTGLAAIQGQTAQAQGLMPLSDEQVVAYNKTRQIEEQKYVAMERETANPFDITNQYSITGSIARTFFNNSGYTLSASSILSMPFSLGSIVSSPSVGALGTNIARYQQCDDKEYKRMKIGADVQCNVRFGMTDEDLSIQPEDAFEYMVENGYIDEETGLPKSSSTGSGYSPPNTGGEQNQVLSFVMDVSSVSDFVSSRDYNKFTSTGSEYAKYLDSCVYRSVPFGETYEEISQINGLNDEAWSDGSKCMKAGAPYSYFRVFTLDKSVMEAEEATVSDSTSSSSNTNVVSTGKYVSPIPTSVKNQRVSATFGVGGYGAGSTIDHNGIDFAYAGDILSICDGVVDTVKISDRYPNSNAYGNYEETNYIYIHCDDGSRFGYAHWNAKDKNPDVTVGARVSAGQKLAVVGMQGNATGPHLHLTTQLNCSWNSSGTFVDGSCKFTDGYSYLVSKGTPLPAEPW